VTVDSAAVPFVVIALVPAVVAVWVLPPVAALALLILPIAIALFFRDPDRLPPADPALVLAPADGRVMYAGPARPAEAPAGEWRQVTIFLSLFDVHINRTPIAGRIQKVLMLPGSFVAAFKPESHQNERSEIWIERGGVVVVARQVVGVLARRVVCRVAKGQMLAAGERIGLMKFGSRMDVFVPPSAEVLVKTGDTVRAGETAIARLSSTVVGQAFRPAEREDPS
jgi:phosphatidylserine decarboxylase